MAAGDVVETDVAIVDRAGQVLALASERPAARRAAELLAGRVLEGGLGYGFTRRALVESPAVASVKTVELSSDVVDAWRQRSSDPDSKFEASIEDQDNVVEVRSVDEELELAAEARSQPYDAAVIHIPVEAWTDGTVDRLRRTFKRPGDRVVVVTESDRLQLAGFHRSLVERHDDAGAYVLVFDRWDPEAGIGERQRPYHPGYGFIPLAQVGRDAVAAEEETP